MTCFCNELNMQCGCHRNIIRCVTNYDADVCRTKNSVPIRIQRIRRTDHSMLNVYVMRIIIRWSLHVSDKCTIFYLICISVICGHSDFGHMWHMTRHTVNRARQHRHERMKSDKWNAASQSIQLSTPTTCDRRALAITRMQSFIQFFPLSLTHTLSRDFFCSRFPPTRDANKRIIEFGQKDIFKLSGHTLFNSHSTHWA